VVFASLHFSNTYVFEKCRYIPIPFNRPLKDMVFSGLLNPQVGDQVREVRPLGIVDQATGHFRIETVQVQDHRL